MPSGEYVPPRLFDEMPRYYNPNTRTMQYALFPDRSPKFLHTLAQFLEKETYQEGEQIIREGEVGYNMYFIWSGSVMVCVGQQMLKVATLKRGSYFGELALYGMQRRTASIFALQRTDCLVVKRRIFSAVLAKFPEEKQYFANLARQRKKVLVEKKVEAEHPPEPARSHSPSSDEDAADDPEPHDPTQGMPENYRLPSVLHTVLSQPRSNDERRSAIASPIPAASFKDLCDLAPVAENAPTQLSQQLEAMIPEPPSRQLFASPRPEAKHRRKLYRRRPSSTLSDRPSSTEPLWPQAGYHSQPSSRRPSLTERPRTTDLPAPPAPQAPLSFRERSGTTGPQARRPSLTERPGTSDPKAVLAWYVEKAKAIDTLESPDRVHSLQTARPPAVSFLIDPRRSTSANARVYLPGQVD